MKKRIIALLLMLVMVCSLLPVAAFADDVEIVGSGTCGTNAKWTLDSNGLLTIKGTGEMTDYDTYGGPWRWKSVKSLVIENGITKIGTHAFDGCNALVSANIPSSVKTIGDYAFRLCTRLTDVTIEPGVTTVGYGAFYSCQKLTSLPLPNTVKKISYLAFSECDSITNLVIPNSVQTIGDEAFYSCDGIVNLIIPDSVKLIYNEAFGDCSRLETVSFGTNVTHIYQAAFYYTPLKDVYYKGTSAQYKAITVDKFNSELTKATVHYNHTHEYTFECTVAPTCTEKGYDKYVCVHGDYKRENLVSAKGHIKETVPGYPATYESEGLTDGAYCSVCGVTLTEQKPIPVLFDNIDELYVSNLSRPAFGQKLDYDLNITANPTDRLITEGDKAPAFEWYAYNEYTGEYDLVTDPDYVCDARAYKLYIYMYPAEHCQFSGTEYWCNGNLRGQTAGDMSLSGLDNNGVCLKLNFVMGYDKAHTISTINYTDMPYCCIVGDRVDAFKPATLENDGKTGTYFWYLEKLDSYGETVGMYVAKDQEANALMLMPEFTSKDLADLRKDFGTTFKSGYYYALYNIQVIPSTYQYDDYVEINIAFRNGDAGVSEFEGQPYGRFVSVSLLPVLLDTVKIYTPDAPKISISKSNGKIKLSWSEVPGADKYYIYRSTDGKTYKYYSSTTKTSYTNSSIKSGTKYYYKVKAVNVVGDKTYYSKYSNAKSAIMLTTPVVKASLSAGSAKLSWDKVTGATKYYIYRSTDGETYKYYSSTTKTSYTNSSVTAGKTYYYKVKAIKAVGDTNYTSSYSSARSVKILKAPVITAANSNGKVKLSWSAVSGAAKYYIYRSTDGETYKYYSSTTKTSYTNSSVTGGTKYYYKVKAVNADGGAGKLSSAKSVVPLAAPVVSVEVMDGVPKLSWDKVTGAKKYYVYTSTDGESFSFLKSTTALTFKGAALDEGAGCWYKVKAVTTVSKTNYYSGLSDAVTAILEPAPEILPE